jgi:hypothetical protein
MNIIPLFCQIDDAFIACEKQRIPSQLPQTPDVPKKRGCPRRLHTSEVMTILVAFHQSQYRTLKHFYLKHVCLYWRWAFPKLVSYNRFVELIPQTLFALTAYLSRCFGKSSGIAFMDSTAIAVCENRRIPSHRVFTGIAERTKTSVGWVYGFKLHLVVNTDGELLAFRVIVCLQGSPNARKPQSVGSMGSNFISSSTQTVNSWHFGSLRRM